MICPNCGAELEQHAFAHVCPFCRYVSADTKVVQRNTDNESIIVNPYENILGNLSEIQQSEFIEIKQNANEYECVSAKTFYPNDGNFNLNKNLELRWYAKATKQSVNLALLAKSNHQDALNYISIKTEDNVFTLKQNGEHKAFLLFPMTLADFICICRSRSVELDTNLHVNAHKNDFEEFITYSHRFYHLVIDKEKYIYSLYQPLLTD